MKKLIILLFILCFIAYGCKEEKKDPIDQTKIDNLIDEIDFTYLNIDELDFNNNEECQNIENIRETYESLNESEKKLVNNYQSLIEIEEKYDTYIMEIVTNIESLHSQKETIDFSSSAVEKEIASIRGKYMALGEKGKQKVTNISLLEELENIQSDHSDKVLTAFEEATSMINDVVPKKTSEDIELPLSYVAQNGIKVQISWTSSQQETLSTLGKISKPRGSTAIVTLKATLKVGSEKKEINKNVYIAPLAYTKLPQKPVFAYYYTNQRSLTDDERKTIDVINLSFGDITSDGLVSVLGLEYSTVLKEREHGIRVCFSVQDKVGFQTFTKTESQRNKLAQSFVDVVNKYHFDGVDIDWEYPEGNEVANYVDFMKKLYTKMKASNSEYLVTSAVYGGNGCSHYDIGVSCNYMDYVHLMTYDLNNENASHLTPLGTSKNSYSSVEKTVEFYVGAGVPKSKLVIGAAMYGKVYELSVSTNGILGEKPITPCYTIFYRDIRYSYLNNLETNPNIIRYWDETAKAPYLYIKTYNSDNTLKSRLFITYDDVESMKIKCDYVLDQDLAGIMFWELGYEDRTTDDLINAIYDTIKKQ